MLASQNSWVVTVFPAFTLNSRLPIITASSPVTVLILQAAGIHPGGGCVLVPGSGPVRTMVMVEPVSTSTQVGRPSREQRR